MFTRTALKTIGRTRGTARLGRNISQSKVHGVTPDEKNCGMIQELIQRLYGRGMLQENMMEVTALGEMGGAGEVGAMLGSRRREAPREGNTVMLMWTARLILSLASDVIPLKR